ncbi:efflux RND transporter periplasmic adaptor subunit [Pseudooceanicola sp. 502str34]
MTAATTTAAHGSATPRHCPLSHRHKGNPKPALPFLPKALLALALIPLLAACKEEAPLDYGPRPVVSILVTPSTIEARGTTGTVTAATESDLGFLTAGRIITRPASVGDTVSAGELLASLDGSDLENTRRSAAAGVSAAEVQLETAQHTLDRVSALQARGVASQSDLEEAQRGLAAAEAERARARAALKRAEDALTHTELKAPRDGVITETYEEPGTVVSAGQAVLHIAATGEREAVIDVAEAAARVLRPGDVFEVSSRVTPGIRTTGTLTEIDPVADATTLTRRAHIALDSPPEGMRLGALVVVRLTGGREERLTIPPALLIRDRATPTVWRITRDGDGDTGTVSAVEIETEDEPGGTLRVLSGLEIGDEIVAKGVNSLKDGDSVGARVQQ